MSDDLFSAAIEGARARDDEIARLRAEVARLREALAVINAEAPDECPGPSHDIAFWRVGLVARAALEGGEG